MGKFSKKQNLEQGAVILLFSTIIVKLIGAFFKIPLSSNFCLGDLGFGYFSAAYDLFTPIYMMAISGFPVAISRMIADYNAKGMKGTAKKAFKVSIKTLSLIGIAGCVLLLLAVIPFVNLTDKSGESIYCFLAVIPAFFFCCIVSCYRGYYEGVFNMVPAAVSNVIEALGKLLLGFTFAFVTVRLTGKPASGAAAALIGITLGTLLSACYLNIKYKIDNKYVDFKTELSDIKDSDIAKLLIVTAIPIVLSSLSGSLVTLIDTFTVRWQLGVAVDADFEGLKSMYSAVIDEYNISAVSPLTAEQFPTLLYGIRSKAYTIYNIVPTFTTALGVGAVPILAKALAKGDKTLIKNSSETVLKFTSLIVFPATAGLLALSDNVMSLLYGKGASAEVGGQMLFIFAAACLFAGLSIPLCSMLQALSLQKSAFLNVLMGMAVKIIGNLVLCSVTKINIFGSVISTLLCYIVIFVLNFIVLLKQTGDYLQMISVFIKPFFAAILCAFSAFVVSLLGDSSIITVLSIAVGVIVYIVALVLLKAISKQEIANFLKKQA